MKNAPELLILGSGGMLGTALQEIAGRRGLASQAYSRPELDITDRAAVRRTVADFAAHVERRAALGVVMNAAAYTDVEKAEDDPERASLVNEVAAGWLAAVSLTAGLRLVHVSTDFVFDGAKTGPYNESDEPRPLNIYGASKLAGEKAVFSAYPGALVVRTSWTYGPWRHELPPEDPEPCPLGHGSSGRLWEIRNPATSPRPRPCRW